MIQEQTIRKLTDYLLQNTCTTNSSGLYNGKAGLSLSLFEAARYLQDENVENRAFELLQEALVDKNKNCSFENGLPGIGYVLLYLIENKLVDADFDEIFGEQYEAIIRSFENIENEPPRLVNSLQAIYYFSKVSGIKQKDDRLRCIIKKIIEGLELFLTIQLNDFMDIHYINNKTSVLNIHKIYLKLICYTNYVQFSKTLLDDFADLYRKGRITSSLAVGHYLNTITKKHKIEKYKDIVEENIINGIKNIHFEGLSLKDRIDLTLLIRDNENKGITHDALLPDLKSTHKEGMIQNLIKTNDKNHSPLGYGTGAGRLLLFYVNKQAELL